MEEGDLDVFLVTHLPNVFYLTGFTGSNAALLLSHTKASLFTDSRYATQARQETSGIRLVIETGPALVAAASTLPHKKRLRVGFEASRVTVSQGEDLVKASGKGIHWIAWDGRVESERVLKDASELTIMREAAAIACRAWKESLLLVKPGILESDLAAEIEYGMRRIGADGPAFATIVASGPRSAWPHAQASRKPLQKNELVVFDLGAILRGYSSDLSRTVYVGHATASLRRTYNSVLEAQQAARLALRPGVTAGSVDAAARGVLRRAGLGARFIHSTGHGLGLEVHEAPRLGNGEKAILAESMVVTIEPGVYMEGQGGIRIEDDALVTKSGAEFLTDAPRELLEI